MTWGNKTDIFLVLLCQCSPCNISHYVVMSLSHSLFVISSLVWTYYLDYVITSLMWTTGLTNTLYLNQAILTISFTCELWLFVKESFSISQITCGFSENNRQTINISYYNQHTRQICFISCLLVNMVIFLGFILEYWQKCHSQ